MKNNTKIRLHLSKNLFESLAKQVLAESKKGDMSGGAYTEAVKAPKAHKEKSPEVKKTDKMKTMGEMETRVAEEGQLNEYIGMSPEEVKAMEILAGAIAGGAGVATIVSGLKQLVSKMKGKKPSDKKEGE
jgi:hypothetical protein